MLRKRNNGLLLYRTVNEKLQTGKVHEIKSGVEVFKSNRGWQNTIL